jgi:hypothetical protein
MICRLITFSEYKKNPDTFCTIGSMLFINRLKSRNCMRDEGIKNPASSEAGSLLNAYEKRIKARS